jgi:hypothetical protein
MYKIIPLAEEGFRLINGENPIYWYLEDEKGELLKLSNGYASFASVDEAMRFAYQHGLVLDIDVKK